METAVVAVAAMHRRWAAPHQGVCLPPVLCLELQCLTAQPAAQPAALIHGATPATPPLPTRLPQSWGMHVTTAARALHCYLRDMHYIVNPATKKVGVRRGTAWPACFLS